MGAPQSQVLLLFTLVNSCVVICKACRSHSITFLNSLSNWEAMHFVLKLHCNQQYRLYFASCKAFF